jgi:radical SAM protein with 4Fe4S-binding SPASM domain
MQFSGSGLVAPCGPLFGERYKRYHIGNIADTPFKQIWQGDRYKEVLDFIASEKFDARNMCGTLCLQEKVNQYLNKIKNGEIQLETPKGNPPRHINFI